MLVVGVLPTRKKPKNEEEPNSRQGFRARQIRDDSKGV